MSIGVVRDGDRPTCHQRQGDSRALLIIAGEGAEADEVSIEADLATTRDLRPVDEAVKGIL